MDRRNFIIKTGIASAAIVTSSSLVANNINHRSKQVSIAVIGTGIRGTGLIKYINNINDLKLVACCDVLPFRLKNGLEKANNKDVKGYQDYREVLQDKSIDAVLIATPFSTHIEIATAAIKAGKHIYCEKTLGRGYTEVQNLVHLVNRSNIVFQTGHQYHSSRLYMHVVDLIKNGKVGKIAAVDAQWNRFHNWRRPVPEEKYERAINWRMYREYSGGLVAELCSHQIDFVNTILDANPTQVMGTGGIDYWKDGRETYDNIHLIYNYPNGVKAKFTCLTSNAKNGYQIKVIGDKGMLVITTRTAKFYPKNTPKPSSTKNKKLAVVDGVSGATLQKDEYGYGEPINIVHDDPSLQALSDFTDAILQQKEPISNVTTGAKAAICVQMGLDAMYQNKIIPWPKDLQL